MKLCLCVLSYLLPIITPAGSFTVEVVTNITQVTEGENFIIRCTVYGKPALHFLGSSNASVAWIFHTNNRVEILGQFRERSFQPKYDKHLEEWNRTSVNSAFQNAINLTIVINEVTQRDKGIYTCLVSMGSEVVRRNLYLTNETTNSSLVFIDYAVPREEADKKCSFYGFKTPDTKTTEHDISYIMQSNETVWTFTDEDRYVLIGHRQWLSIRGCHHINLTHNGQLHHNCNLVFDSPDSMMSSYIGIHKTSCYLIPENIKEFEKTQLPESLCGWRCTDVIETSYGGTEAISLYKVIEVTYKTFSGFKPPHEEQCNALYLADVEVPYQRIACQNTSTCSALCLQSIRKNTIVIKYRNTSLTEWIKAWKSCVEHNASLPDERGNFSYDSTEFPCLGIIRSSQLIFNERALGVFSKKENGSVSLESTRGRRKNYPFICEILRESYVRTNDSNRSQTSNNAQMSHDSIDTLLIIIPTSLLGLSIVSTMIICVIKRMKKKKEEINTSGDITTNAVLTNEVTDPVEYEVLQQMRETTQQYDVLFHHAKEKN